MVEIRNSTGVLDFDLVTPEIISSLDEPQQQALLALMEAARAKDAAVERRNAATKRVHDAIADEEVKRLAHEDAPNPFRVAEFEKHKGRPLTAVEVQEARERHAQRVRAHLEAEAREAAVRAFNSSH